jgi:long-chain acyl-CoA synthetase
MLMNMLRASAETSPDGTAVKFSDQSFSYAELYDIVEGFVAILGDRGIHRSSKVAMILPNSPEFVVSFFSLASIEAMAVPLNPDLKDGELLYYLSEAEIEHILCPGSCEQRFVSLVSSLERTSSVHGIDIEKSFGAAGAIPGERGATRKEQPDPDAMFLYQYSSGTTGPPKRVMRSQRQCVVEAENFLSTCRTTPRDRFLCVIPLYHAHGLGNCMLAAMKSAATLVIMKDPQPLMLKRMQLLELIEKEGITVFPGVPFIAEALVSGSQTADLSSMRLFFVGGSALDRSTLDGFHEKYGIHVRQAYGATETGLACLDFDGAPVPTCDSVGRPVNGVTVKVVDESGRALPPMQEGEIGIKSPAMANGYHAMDELNERVFVDGYFYPGDTGRLDDDGRLFITGRKRRFIEVVGRKVDPAIVENALCKHPLVSEVSVLGVKNRTSGAEQIKAVIVTSSECSEAEIKKFCLQHLANFEVPQIIEFREELPRNQMGKILREKLLD